MNKVFAFLLIFIFCFYTSYADTPAIPLDGSAASVNETTISVTEVLITLQPVRRMLEQKHSGEDLLKELHAAYERTLDSLIERQLILDEYKKQQKFAIPENLIDIQITEMIHTRFNGSRAELLKTLQADEISKEEWRNEIRNRMIVSFMRNQAVESNRIIPPKAVREAYEKNISKYRSPEKVELRMIVINKGNTEQEVTVRRRQAQEVREKLLGGEDFEKLAKEVSEGTKADDGGYWGWITPESRRSELASVLIKLDPAEISDVIEAGDAFYILKVDARKHAFVTPFEDVQEEIQGDLTREKAQKAYEAWIENLKQKAYIKKY